MRKRTQLPEGERIVFFHDFTTGEKGYAQVKTRKLTKEEISRYPVFSLKDDNKGNKGII